MNASASSSGLALLGALLLSACAQMEVKRTAEHASAKAEYLSALARAVPFSGGGQCTRKPGIGQWEKLQFDRSTPIVQLPNGVSAAAYCLAIPAAAAVMQFASDSQGGMTYQQSTVVLPSLLFLDGEFAKVKDDPLPDANYNSRMASSGLDGTVALGTELRTARYVVVYLHPKALDTGVKIDGQAWQTTVPFNPYGAARIKFHSVR